MRKPGPSRARSVASASRQVAPRSVLRRLEPRRLSPSSIDQHRHEHRARGARPMTTIASQPQRLPAIAKPLLASESLKRPVSGLLLTTANLAEVVSGLPTSGLNAKTSGASGASGSPAARPSSSSSHAPRPLPPRNWRSTCSSSGTRSARPHVDVDAEIAAVVAEGHGRPTRRRRRTESARSRRSASGVAGSLTNRSPLRLAANAGCSRSPSMSSASDGRRAASVPSSWPSVVACTSSSAMPARSRGTPRNSTCMVVARRSDAVGRGERIANDSMFSSWTQAREPRKPCEHDESTRLRRRLMSQPASTTTRNQAADRPKAKKGRVRATPKGRRVDPGALADVRALLGDAPRRRDLLIEHLHRIQDRYGCLSARAPGRARRRDEDGDGRGLRSGHLLSPLRRGEGRRHRAARDHGARLRLDRLRAGRVAHALLERAAGAARRGRARAARAVRRPLRDRAGGGRRPEPGAARDRREGRGAGGGRARRRIPPRGDASIRIATSSRRATSTTPPIARAAATRWRRRASAGRTHATTSSR